MDDIVQRQEEQTCFTLVPNDWKDFLKKYCSRRTATYALSCCSLVKLSARSPIGPHGLYWSMLEINPKDIGNFPIFFNLFSKDDCFLLDGKRLNAKKRGVSEMDF